MVQLTVMDSVANIKNTNNYYDARDIADSLTEFLQFELKKHDSGYNVHYYCRFDGGKLEKESAIVEPVPASSLADQICLENFSIVVGDQDVEIDIMIKGRAYEEERMSGSFSSYVTSPQSYAYIIPTPGTGNAGKNCNLYTLNHSPSDVGAELDNLCNWNKLQFGSTSTDRVSIPLYYEGENGVVVNPFFSESAQDISIRMRVPCESGDYSSPECSLEDRGEDYVVVQWQINGKCDDGSGGEEECGLIQYILYEQNGMLKGYSSAISKQSIEGVSTKPWGEFVAWNASLTNAISTVEYKVNLSNKIIGYLKQTIKKPILTLNLSDTLRSENNITIPYLEYQIISSKLLSNPQAHIVAKIKVNGNVYDKNVYVSESTDLIDFAIQN